MNGLEFSTQFDILFNNITSNQAPGLNDYEKSVFLTKAQDELLKNYFSGITVTQEGFDDSSKRQLDFSTLMREYTEGPMDSSSANHERGRSYLIQMPNDIFRIVNEQLRFNDVPPSGAFVKLLQVIPITYMEYTRVMSKPFTDPLKRQVWRLMTSTVKDNVNYNAKLLIGSEDSYYTGEGGSTIIYNMTYELRYIKLPKPIVLTLLDARYENVTIKGEDGSDTTKYTPLGDTDLHIENPCELDVSIQDEILQRAVEIAKVAWLGTAEQTQQSGQRSE